MPKAQGGIKERRREGVVISYMFCRCFERTEGAPAADADAINIRTFHPVGHARTSYTYRYVHAPTIGVKYAQK